MAVETLKHKWRMSLDKRNKFKLSKWNEF